MTRARNVQTERTRSTVVSDDPPPSPKWGKARGIRNMHVRCLPNPTTCPYATHSKVVELHFKRSMFCVTVQIENKRYLESFSFSHGGYVSMSSPLEKYRNFMTVNI